jgi:electron transfer flavoprotein alpha/beta subunit
MNTVVCVKQVPDTTEVRLDPETNTLIREGVPSIVNPFDKHALEAALALKDRFGGTVTALSMGPAMARLALWEALAMGADRAVLLSDRAFAGADTLATSYTLAMAIRKLGRFDLIICGKQAIDGDTAQVGPGIAEHLHIPQVTCVCSLGGLENGELAVQRQLDNRYERVAVRLPALLAVERTVNTPRYATMGGVMRAVEAEVEVWDAQTIGADPARLGLFGSPTQVRRVFAPERRQGGQVFAGAPAETVPAAIERLRELKVI